MIENDKKECGGTGETGSPLTVGTSATEVQFRTAPNPVRTTNRTGSLVLVLNLAEPEPRVRFGVQPIPDPLNGLRTRFKRVQTAQVATLFFLFFTLPHLTFHSLHSILGCNTSTPGHVT